MTEKRFKQGWNMHQGLNYCAIDDFKTKTTYCVEEDIEDVKKVVDLLNSFENENEHFTRIASSFAEENEKLRKKNKQLEKENKKLKSKWFNNINWDSILDQIIIYGVMILSIIGAGCILILITNLVLGG